MLGNVKVLTSLIAQICSDNFMTVVTVTDIKKRHVTADTQQITTVATGTLVKQRPYPQVHPLN